MKDISGVYLDVLNEEMMPSKGIVAKDVKYKLKDRMSDMINFHNTPGRSNLVLAKIRAEQLAGRVT